MDKRLLRFYKNSKELEKAIEDGKDVYSTFASRIFNCNYEDCLAYKDGCIYVEGAYRRKVAKIILCGMYFSTKHRWRKEAFRILDCFEFDGFGIDVVRR